MEGRSIMIMPFYKIELKYIVTSPIFEFFSIHIFRIFCFIFLFFIPQLLGNNKDTCVKCHKIATPKVAREYLESVHSRNIDLTCTFCHGGDNKEESEEKAHNSKDFRGKISKKDIPALCSGCHSDIKLMKLFRLNTNVYNEYLTSKHAKLLMERGDEKVAVCSDCHSVHNILSKKDPASATYKLNIPKTCGRCHANKEYMKDYNIPTNQVEEYSSGIHGQILQGKIKGKNPLSVPTCVDCHGAHGALPPEITDLHFMCGTCHFAVLQYFKLGPHFDALKVNGSPKCIDCHGSHRNTLPAEGLLVSSDKGVCSSCHKMTEEKKVYNVIQTMYQMISNIQNDIKELNNMVSSYSYDKYPEIFTMAEANLEKMRKSLSHLQSITHSLDIKLIENEYKTIAGLLTSTKIFKEKFLSKENEWSFRFVLFVVGVILLGLLLLSFLIAKFVLKRFRVKGS